MTDQLPSSVAGPRREHDSLGDADVPADAYWGISTLRAVDNFPVSGRTIGTLRSMMWGLGAVKYAAARANESLGLLEPDKSAAIQRASREVMDGLFDDQFVVDTIQGGAGTSTNMNANEVIANRALELMGHRKGDYAALHPIDDVNRSQSTNDVYPTAIKIALQREISEFCAEHSRLIGAFDAKAAEFAGIIKVGRTQLQDAVPMSMGQEFGAFAETLREDGHRLIELLPHLRESNLGATAIGTGITAPPGYREAVIRELNSITGLQQTSAANLVEATSDTGVFLLVSGVLKRAAVKLSKICSDLRLLSSGPQTGFAEIFLPAVQAGSSIMPGKVNPVIPEMVNQVAFRVIGADATVTMAAEAGQLQLNAFEPVIADSLLESIAWLRVACRQLRTHCVDGITANTQVLQQRMLDSISVVTGLAPLIGYAAAAELAKEALASHRGIADLVIERGLLSEQKMEDALSPRSLAGLG
ncbi:aspartate ammonia-lyase [Arthrobacter globiformis]|uniref:aspartate ammonia-lyase n=1 Tax=Arthrobacter globiformis TaxID=1665 RepID=UPI00278B7EB8|nr:aspartate ammonia-lyase [Arthrobacter globiformis]MDQ0865083.1 aspartate ammonia-lyase [Arthrobacter globiformis]